MYSGAWDLGFMQDISGEGASRLGVEYVNLSLSLNHLNHPLLSVCESDTWLFPHQ